MLIYTRMIFKRPPITETAERTRIAARQKQPAAPAKSGVVQFEPFTVNIKSVPVHPLPSESNGSQIKGKTHFATVGIALELRDGDKKFKIDDAKPILMDKLLSHFGTKNFNEITTVQGRYLLRNDILDLVNEVVKDPLVTNVFFTQFIVQ